MLNKYSEHISYDLADGFGHAKAFVVLKNYRHPGDGQVYAAILIDESENWG
jgi:stress response protein SCP2